jgi:hypothetical protein
MKNIVITLGLSLFIIIPFQVQATPVLNFEVLSCEEPIVTRVEKLIKINSQGEKTESFLKGWECPKNTEFSENDADCVLTFETQNYQNSTILKKTLQCAAEIPDTAQILESQELPGYQELLEIETQRFLFKKINYS